MLDLCDTSHQAANVLSFRATKTSGIHGTQLAVERFISEGGCDPLGISPAMNDSIHEHVHVDALKNAFK